MAFHDIRVRVMDGQAIPEIPPPGVLRVGDTVSYSSEDGEVMVVFDLPFSTFRDVVHHGEKRQLIHAGTFFGKCSVTLADGTRIDWSPDKPLSGGEHDVRP